MTTMSAANRRRLSAFAAAVPVLLFLAVYLPAAGRGFLKDDFGWILGSRADGWRDLVQLFTANVGFYRPLVSLTFAADHALWGLNAAGYGMTNVALAGAGAAALYALARRLALPPPAALVAASVWALNLHAVNMALLWLSGRTALLVVLFALLTAHAMLRGWRLPAGLACLCALLSKEEAVLLPVLWTAFDALNAREVAWRHRPVHLARRTWPLWAALGVYAWLREQSGAFSAADAPPYYQFSFAPALVARNLLEYADRAGTTAALVTLVLVAAAGWRRLRFEPPERRAALLAALWIPAGYALTLFLPLRSSLYALLPSVGAALLAGVVAASAARARPERMRHATVALLLLATALAPVYVVRTYRWTVAADLSAGVMALVRDAAASSPGGHVVLVEDPGARFSADAVFSGQFPDAVTLFSDGTWTGAVAAPGEPHPPDTSLVIELRDGQPVVTQPSRTIAGPAPGL